MLHSGNGQYRGGTCAMRNHYSRHSSERNCSDYFYESGGSQGDKLGEIFWAFSWFHEISPKIPPNLSLRVLRPKCPSLFPRAVDVQVRPHSGPGWAAGQLSMNSGFYRGIPICAAKRPVDRRLAQPSCQKPENSPPNFGPPSTPQNLPFHFSQERRP